MKTYIIKAQHYSGSYDTFHVEHDCEPTQDQAVRFLKALLGDKSCYYKLTDVFVMQITATRLNSWI